MKSLKNLFEPEDFCFNDDTVKRDLQSYLEQAAKQAQKVLDEYINANAKRVYNWTNANSPDWHLNKGFSNEPTHQALLLEIEEIEKKKCEHIAVCNDRTGYIIRCGGCYKWIEPSGWKVIG